MAAKLRKMWQNSLTLLCFLVVWGQVSCKEKAEPIELDEDNWRDMLEGEWFVKFYAPWCPACNALEPVWRGLASWSDDLQFSVAQIDVTKNPGLSGRFLVTALPSLYHVKDGEFRYYRGSRKESELIAFIDEKAWKNIEPVTQWKSPDTLQMGALGLFFKASMLIRNMHTAMTETYGIPVWGSYATFAIMTILVGLALGLVIVFLCDVCFPPKPHPLPSQYSAVPRATPPHVQYEDKDNEESEDIEDDREVKSEEKESLRKRNVNTAEEKEDNR